MNGRPETLAAKRARLIVQSAQQRAALAQQFEPWRTPLAVADQGVAIVRTVSQHPLLVAGVAVLLMAWRPRRAVRWLQYGWMAWQVVQQLRNSDHPKNINKIK